MSGDSQDKIDPNAPTATAERALEWVQEGQMIGLGTGRAAAAFVRALAKRVADGLDITGVPTSIETGRLAQKLGIPLLTLEEARHLDVTFDGADEVDPQLDVIKGYGGAHVREKVVAACSDQLVILVGSEKIVPVLGSRGKLPVEVIPFAEAHCREALRAMGCGAHRRLDPAGKEAFVTDNGNLILDCKISPIEDAAALDRAMLSIPGVLGTGLFVGMASAVIIQSGDQVSVRTREATS